MATPFEDAFVQDLQLFGRGRNELAGVGESGKEGMLEDIYFAAGGGGAVTDRIEVAVQLEEVVVVLGLVGGVKVIFAAEVCEGSSLSELYRLALDEDGQGCGGRFLRVDLVVGEFICAELACSQVEFEYLSKCCNQVGLLLQAGQVAAEG